MFDRKRIVLLLSTALLALFSVLLLRSGWEQASASAQTAPQRPGTPTALDQDGDGLPDSWETAHGLDPHIGTGVHGPNGDPDHDGLSNADEFLNGTDPQNPDTDGDGLSDQWEVENQLNPLSAVGIDGANGDPDNDGLLNKDEMLRGTDPHNPDSDGDGMPDGYEVIKGMKPNDNRGINGANGDRNNDGETNLSEFERLNDDYSLPVPLPPKARR